MKSSDLQATIDAAAPGDTVQIQGVCVGTFTIAKDLRLVGRQTPTVPQATLDGGNVGEVVFVGGRVSITNLRITNGNNPPSSPRDPGGGIVGTGRLILLGNTSVDHNTTNGSGGGISFDGRVVLNDSAHVHDNSADVGGGISNAGQYTIVNDSAQVNHNHAGEGGGGIQGRHVFLNGAAQVDHNSTNQSGGGIIGLFVTLNGTAQVNDNSADAHAGGAYVYKTITLTGSSEVDNNTAVGVAGGILINSPRVVPAVTLKDGASVTGNTAGSDGAILAPSPGEVAACNSVGLDHWTGAISPNTPDDPPTVTPITC